MSRSSKPKVMIGRMVIQSPEELAAEAQRQIRAAMARNKSTQKALLAGHSRDTYQAGDDPVRPGADDALAIPSRIGDRLHYRDGRVLPFPIGVI